MAFIDTTESRDRKLALLLQTANQLQTHRMAQEELNLKKQELDPKYQASKLASTMAMLGQTDAAERLMNYSKDGGVVLPSQNVTSQPQNQIPDYLGGGNRISASNVGLGSPGMGGMGITGGSVNAKGGFTAKIGTPGMSKYDEANLDIAKSVKTEQLKKAQEAKTGLDRTMAMEDVYLNQYAKSYEEVSKFDPEIGRKGAGGYFSRGYGKVMKNIDELPQTKALDKLAKPIAQEIAASLEGRATDEDRKVQLDLLVNALSGPTEEQITNASNNLLLMEAKGADIGPYVERLNNSRIPILKQIAKEVYKSSKSAKQSGVDVNSIFEGL